MISEREGPTTSPQTNLLIHLCLQAIETRQVPDQMVHVLENRESGLEVARQDFVGKVQEQGEQHVQIFQNEIDEVTAAFDGYREALGHVRTFVETRQVPSLQQAVQQLTAITPRLVAALDAYEAKFMVVGPSQYPIVNIWTKILDAVRRRTMPRETLLTMAQGAREFFGKCLEEMHSYPEGDNAAGAVVLLKDGYVIFMSAMDEVEAYTQDASMVHLDDAMARITRAHTRMQEGFDAYRDAKVTGGPTRSKPINMMLNAADMARQGSMSDGTFREGLDHLDEFFRAVKTRFEGLTNVHTDSTLIQENIHKARDAMRLFEDAIRTLRTWQECKNPSSLDSGVQMLTRAAHQIAEVEDAFKLIADNEGKLPCIKCGTANNPDNKNCIQCGAQLPRTARLHSLGSTEGTVGGDDVEVGENLARLIDATNKVHVGRISHEAYADVLAWMEGLLNDAEASLAATDTVRPEQFQGDERVDAIQARDLVEETREMFLSGILDFRGGLAQLSRFAQDGDENHLIEGLRTVWDAYKIVFQVGRIGREAGRQLGTAEPPGGDEVQITRG